MSKKLIVHAIGRRKTSVSRVYLCEGTGTVTVNKKPLTEYFDTLDQTYAVLQPLKLLGVDKQFDVVCSTKGSGKRAQAGAVLLGVARALKAYEQQHMGLEEGVRGAWHDALKRAGLLTCDSRKVERKKFGLRGARVRPQYSKR